jgi:hypothetical protein
VVQIRPGFLSPEQRVSLEKVVRRTSNSHGVARRANAVLLLDDGLSCEAVAKVLYLDDGHGAGLARALGRGRPGRAGVP